MFIPGRYVAPGSNYKNFDHKNPLGGDPAMRKSGIQNFARDESRIVKTLVPELPRATDMTDCDLDTYLVTMCEVLQAREKGAQELLRQDLTRAYADARQIADNQRLCSRFLALQRVKRLPRPPKNADHILHAILKLAYTRRIASARNCRLKRLWKSNASVEEVYADLAECGSSPKCASGKFDPASLKAFGLLDLQIGAGVGLFIWATLETPSKFSLEIVDRAEWPN